MTSQIIQFTGTAEEELQRLHDELQISDVVSALRSGMNSSLPLRPVAVFTALVQAPQVSTVHGSGGNNSAADIEAAVGGLAPESKHAAVLCRDAVKALLTQQ